MRTKKFALIVVSLFFVTSMSQVAIATEDINQIGTFDRLGVQEKLTTEDVIRSGDALTIQAPLMASNLRIETSYLVSELGAWATDTQFSLSGETHIIVDGEDTTFRPFILGEGSVFTSGSSQSVSFADRPMWISISSNGDGYKLEMDDGDTSGQTIHLNKGWLWSLGIHRPQIVHEDGSELAVTRAADGSTYSFDMPHFSWVLLTGSEIDVKGRVGGEFVPHTGEKRWDSATKTLQVDVDPQVTEYELWIEADFIDARIPDPALLDRRWEMNETGGTPYYVVSYGSNLQTQTATFTVFSLDMGRAFSAGSYKSLYFGHPIETIIEHSPTEFNITFMDAVAEALYVTANLTWLNSTEIDYPEVWYGLGRGNSYSFPNYMYFQFPVPMNETWAQVKNGTQDQADGTGAINDIMTMLDDTFGEGCRTKLGGGVIERFGKWEEPNEPSKAAVWGKATTFCFEWELSHPDATFYGVVYGMTNDGESLCSSGMKSSHEVTNYKGIAVCEWPSDEPLPFSHAAFHFFGGAYWYVKENQGPSVQTGVACGASGTVTIVAAGAGALGFAPAWHVVRYVGEFAFGECTTLTLEYLADIKEGDGTVVGATLLAGETAEVGIEGKTEAWITDPDDYREDTWNNIEWLPSVQRPNAWDGTQNVYWWLYGVENGQMWYDSDLSGVLDLQYNTDLLEAEWRYGGFHGEALVSTFDVSDDGWSNTHRMEIKNDSEDDALDWETPEGTCIVLDRIVSASKQFIDIGDPDLCALVVEESADDSDPWFEFVLHGTDLPSSSILATSGNVSVNDVVNEGGNITRAIAKKLVSDQDFIDSIDHVTVPTLDLVGETQCGTWNLFHNSIFTTRATGSSIIGPPGMRNLEHNSNLDVLICFHPLPSTKVVRVTW